MFEHRGKPSLQVGPHMIVAVINTKLARTSTDFLSFILKKKEKKNENK